MDIVPRAPQADESRTDMHRLEGFSVIIGALIIRIGFWGILYP